MIHKKIPSGIAVTLLSVGCALIGVFEWGALNAQDHPAPRRIDAAYCTSCHSDTATLRAMKRKEGNTHFLFHGPTAFHDAPYHRAAAIHSAAGGVWPRPRMKTR